MTLRTSLFNFGIYKNAVSRFRWGMILYAILLFLSTPFAILVDGAEKLSARYLGGKLEGYMLFAGDYYIIPLLFAIVVPTIVAVLAFNNVHSARQGIFEHSIPVTREKNYTSILLAGFTLMAAPVILNALILLVMSFTGFSALIYPHTVIAWTLYQLAVIFVMFSISVFAGFLTGNAAAHIGINVLIHVIPVLLALVIFLVSDIFLYGFTESENFIANQLIEYNPVVWFFAHFSKVSMFSKLPVWIYLIVSVLFYIGGYLLYKNRKIESCGDVAAFSWFKPLLKYFVTGAASIVVFGTFYSSSIGTAPLFILAGVISAICYFATEMIMNKSFRVFRAYKGFIGFSIFVALFISFFCYTGVFGYETRIPDIEDIESASISRNRAYDAVFVTGDDIETVCSLHKNFITDIKEREKSTNNISGAFVTYKLKNGKTMQRQYAISTEEYYAVFDKMYEIPYYKLKNTGIDNLNIENIDMLSLRAYVEGYSYHIAISDDAPEILNAVKKDIEALSFTEIEKNSAFNIVANVSCTIEDNDKLKYFKETRYENDDDRKYMQQNFSISINGSFKNTLDVLKKLGYYDEITDSAAKYVYLAKIPAKLDSMTASLSYKDDKGSISEFRFSVSDCAKLSLTDGKRFIEELLGQDAALRVEAMTFEEAEKFKLEELSESSEDVHFVFVTENTDDIWASSYSAYYTLDDMPDYLKKYL